MAAPAPTDVLAALSTRDVLAWAKLRIPAMVPAQFAPFHRDVVAWPNRGEWQVRVLFRGAAKSTLTKAMVVHACQHNRATGVLVLRAIASDAKQDREALVRLANLVGLPTYVDGDRGLVLVNGVPVWTRTPGGAVRGLQYVTTDGQVIRPDTIIVDDLETRESAESKVKSGKFTASGQTAKLEKWLTADALQTAGRGEENAARVIMLGTPISPTSLIAKAMRREAPFDTWLPPLVVPYVGEDGTPAWPDLYEPDLKDKVPALVWATEYDLNPLPEGALVFPPAQTIWAETPDRCMVAIGVDPAGDGDDRTAMFATALTPNHGLHTLDADLYDGPAQNMPERVGAFVRKQQAAGHMVFGVSVEAVGGWEFAVPRIRQQCQPVPVQSETPRTSKLERALRLTLWHQAGQVTWSPHLRGSEADVECHTWTQAGHTVSGHDDAPDAWVWSAGLATHGWSAPIPAGEVA